MTEEVKQASVSLKRPQIADMEEAKKKREKTFEDKLLRKMQQEYMIFFKWNIVLSGTLLSRICNSLLIFNVSHHWKKSYKN